MMKAFGIALLAFSATAFAAPLFPNITSHDFGFGAHNQPGQVEYETNGLAPDTLIFTQSLDDHEVTTYWPAWPDPPTYPVWSVAGVPIFGGDLLMAVQFTGQDAPFGSINVSLIGTGLNQGPDLQIFGTIVFPNFTLQGLLWSVDLQQVSLYGYANQASYSLEGLGTLVGGLVSDHFGLEGQPACVRGSLSFVGRPGDWIPPLYNPTADARQTSVRASYSGETGVVPEPAAIGLLLVGAVAALRRR